jgi:glucokinase
MNRTGIARPPLTCSEQSAMPKRKPGSVTVADLIMGIDIGGTSIKGALVDPGSVADEDAGVLGRAKADTRADEGWEQVAEQIDDLIDDACDDAGADRASVRAIGVAVAGAIDHVEGVVLNAVNLKWENVALARGLKEHLDLHAVVENDVRAAIYGEKCAGAAAACRDVFGVWVGTGIGGGLIIGGELFYGSFGTAGEFGRGMVLPWTPPGEGSLEQVCSRTGMSEAIVRLLRSNRKSSLEAPENGDSRRLKSKEIARAFSEEDELVVEVVTHAAQVLGVAIAGVVTLLSLECVVLGGGFVDALGKPYVELVRESVTKAVFPDQARAVKVLRSSLGDDAGPIGAALLAARRLGVRAKAPAA